MSRKIKYITTPMKVTPALRSCLDEVPRRGGFYNWLYLFHGEVEAFQFVEDWEKYDVIHINMSPVDQQLVSLIREKIGWNSSTKIVVNNDHVSEIWGDFDQYLEDYLRVQKMADMVFGTEKHQTSSLIDGAFCMPHPHWIEFLKHWDIRKGNVQDGKIGTIFHWWHGDMFIPAQTIHRFKSMNKTGKKIYSRVYAFDPKHDRNKKWSRVFFDDYVAPMAFQDYIKHLATNEFIYEPCPYHTYGRNSVDAAALGIPMLGSDRVDSMQRCFPYTSCDPYDTRQIIRNMNELMINSSWRDHILDYAKKEVEYYSYKNSEERFLTALDMVKDKKNKCEGHWNWNVEKKEWEVY